MLKGFEVSLLWHPLLKFSWTANKREISKDSSKKSSISGNWNFDAKEWGVYNGLKEHIFQFVDKTYSLTVYCLEK